MAEAERNGDLPTALYARASRDAKGKSRSVTAQTDDGLEVVREKKGTIDPRPYYEGGDLYQDNDIGASEFSKKSRVAYLALLAAIEAGRYKMVVMSVEDRTHRQVLELAEFIKLCKKHGIRVVTLGTEYDLSDPDQLSIWYVKVRFAEAEVEKLSKRVRRGKELSAKRGMVSGGGRRPFGEQGRQAIRDDDGNVVEVVPIITLSQAMVERECITEAVDYLLDGGSLHGLAKEWKARGVKTPTGLPFTAVRLREMLLSPRLAGFREHNGQRYAATAWTPIVDPAPWQELHDLLTNPARTVNRGSNNQRYPLTGILLCGRCGARMAGRIRKYRWKGKLVSEYRTYACMAVMGGCNGMSWTADDLEDLIFRALFQAVESEDFVEAAASLKTDDPTREHFEALARITAALDKLDDEAVEASLEDDGIDPERVKAAIKRKRDRLDAEAEQHWAIIERTRNGRTRAHIPRNLAELWPDYSLDRQKAILGSVIDWIKVYPRKTRKTFDPTTVQYQLKNWT
jgi:DNA invertase Pin-like site-specific DNA recombinase